MRQRLTVTIIVVFFLGFPFAGLLWAWNHAHANIESSAITFARPMVVDVLQDWDTRLLDELGTKEYRDSKATAEFASHKASLGEFKEVGALTQVQSVVGERGDTVWQFVKYKCDVKYSKGSAELRFTVARRTMNPEWRVEAFELLKR